MRLDRQPAAAIAVQRFVEHVRNLPDVLEVRLFGSSARDDWRPDSDVDLLVVVREKRWPLVKDIHEPWLEGLVENGIDLSPRVVSADPLERLRERGAPFVRAVAQEGITLWKADVTGRG